MNAPRQTLHLVANDLRRNWALWVGYAAVWSLVTTQSRYPYVIEWRSSLYLLRLAIGTFAPALIAARLVQDDSPLEPTSFWRSKPIDPGAMLSAKLLSIFLLAVSVPLLLRILTHLFPHILYELSDADYLVRFVPLSALVGLVIGSLTRDVRVFALLSAMLAALSVYVGERLFTHGRFEESLFPPSHWRILTIVLLHVAVLIEMYVVFKRRDVKQIPALSLAILILLPLLGYFFATVGPTCTGPCVD